MVVSLKIREVLGIESGRYSLPLETRDWKDWRKHVYDNVSFQELFNETWAALPLIRSYLDTQGA